MKRRLFKPGLVFAAALATFTAAVPAVLAATGATGLTPKSSHMSLVPHTKLTFTVTKDTDGILTGHKLTCTAFSASLTMPATGFTFSIGSPKFTGCTDNLKSGDKDTMTPAGKWSGVYTNSAKPSIGIKMPKNGLSVVSSYEKSCAIFLNPKGTNPALSGPYNSSTGHLTITKAPDSYEVGNAPHQTSTCPVTGDTGTVTLTATFVTSPVVKAN